MNNNNLYSLVRVKESSPLESILLYCEAEIRILEPHKKNWNFLIKLEHSVVKLLMMNEERLHLLSLQQKGKLNYNPLNQNLQNSFLNIYTKDWAKNFTKKYWDSMHKALRRNGVFEGSESYCYYNKESTRETFFPKSYALSSSYDCEGNFELIRSEYCYEKESNWDDFSPENRQKWERVTIDKDVAWEELKNSRIRKKWSLAQYYYQACITMSTNIGHKEPTICSTGREFNQVNGLPREVRKAVRIDGEPVVELDLKSSQPTILYSFIEDENERKAYKKLITEGKLYEEMIPYIDGYFDYDYKADDERDMAKLCFCKLVAGADIRRNRNKNPYGVKRRFRQTTGAGLCARFFLDRFPKLYRRMRKMNFEKKGELVRELQRIEASIVVEGMKELDVLTGSIHDGIIVKSSESQEAHDFLKKKFTQTVGITPVITGLPEPSNSSDDTDSEDFDSFSFLLDDDHDDILDFVPNELEPLTADDVFGSGILEFV